MLTDEDMATPPEPQGSADIRAAVAPCVNLADFQNSVPAIRELVVTNGTTRRLQELDLTVHSEPAFIKTRTWHLEAIDVGQSIHLSDLDTPLEGGLLSRLTEAEKAAVRFTLARRGSPAEVLATLEVVTELLPRNQWGGIGQLPEMVAAFVQPNNPGVERLLKSAARVLESAGKSSAIDGYEHGPRRAWELTSAVWSAVTALNLDYALPPASFEETGQKVRGASQVLESGLATCLDLALLFASCLEQAHLNPLLVFLKQHVFVGVWLRSEEFATPVVDDVTALRKRVQLKELLVFETTLATQRSAANLLRACDHAYQQIAEDTHNVFELAVDVRRARLNRIKPLASAEPVVPRLSEGVTEVAPPVFVDAPELPDSDTPADSALPSDPTDRLGRWRRKLLDLSLRNNLLNFKPSKRTVTIVAPEPAKLEDLLADEQTLKLFPQPPLMEGSDPRSKLVHESRDQEGLVRQHALDALAKREVFVPLPADEMNVRLTELYRAARSAMQEGGANTLFLALGFLTWTRDDKPEKQIKAPLVLLPVTLSRRNARSGFTIAAHEDEPRVNPTLLEMLRQDIDLDLGLGDGELPRDDAGIDVASIWSRVTQGVKDIRGWEVSTDVALAMFSFAKFLMWKDLNDQTDRLRQSPVVRHLIDTPREVYPSDISFPEPRRLDSDFSPQQTLCPLPSDSSQLSAVMAAVNGKDFVLIGPPGTGKSQTIANLIAHSIAAGKRVLFVAEKIAALNVVHGRLRQVGLAEFCLELHSNKASKQDVVQRLGKAWESRATIDPSAWLAEAQRLKALRDDLSSYVQRLHHRHSNGWTIYRAIATVAEGESIPQVRLGWQSASTHDAAAMATLREVVTGLEVHAKAVGASGFDGALACVWHTDWSPLWQQRILDALGSVASTARGVQLDYARFREAAGLPVCNLAGRARAALSALATLLPTAYGHRWGFLLGGDAATIADHLRAAANLLGRHRTLTAEMTAPWSSTESAAVSSALLVLEQRDDVLASLGECWTPFAAAELERGVRLLEELTQLRAKLSVAYTSDIDTLNVAQLHREWTKAEQSIWPLSWLRRRTLRKQVESVVEGDAEPCVADDLATWVSIRTVQKQISDVAVGSQLDGVWAGLKTRVQAAKSALRANTCLECAKSDQPWEDSGLEAAAAGQCGDRWATEVRRLRELRALDARIHEAGNHLIFLHGIWAGRWTDRQRLRAAINFERERLSIRQSGYLASDHPTVADGRCGSRLREEHERLLARAAVEVEVDRLADLESRTTGLWKGLATDAKAVSDALAFFTALAPVLIELTQCGLEASQLEPALRSLVADRNHLLAPAAAVSTSGNAFVEACGQLKPAIDMLAEGCAFPAATRQQWLDADLAALCQWTDALTARHTQLRGWCAWRKVRAAASSVGLSPLVDSVERGNVEPSTIPAAFEVNFCRWWLAAVVEAEPVVRTFVSVEHERRISDFRSLDDTFTGLTRQWIRARLSESLPSAETVHRSSEWGVLRHEMNKKKRHLPLRELLSQIPSVVKRLTPCLLMSPLSVAQYLRAGADNFDVVVFDEASQIPVWDALGAMSRARQVVMVGDPKQLPPTTFFDRADSEPGDDDVEMDLESILDECLSAGLPKSDLTWHYRSKHESLIAFSNSRYYGGGLVTFPSPVTDDTAVSFHHVPGIYEKGGARINQIEAKALVADLVGQLRSRGFAESGLTIGVVTFNAEQQGLIEDLLDDARRRDPSLEQHFSEVRPEPVFVKNLESVQGDERDIMYFSTTYGPDPSGAISMNFGPLNRDGGERRLNVAITRARHQLRVFASLTGDQIDLSRTRAVGVQDLKHFLEYAQRGPRALAEAVMGSRGDFESPFEEAVAAALSRKGWTVHTQIGVSAFRVDLGVVHPDMPGRYLAGVECDGATYHRAATARDRDKLREQVLRGLGWTILRIWSTDWWIDPRGTLEDIHARLTTCLESERLRRPAASIDHRETLQTVAPESPVESAKEPGEDAEMLPFYDAGTSAAAELAREPAFEYADNRAAPQPSLYEQTGVFVEAEPLNVVSAERVKVDQFFERSYDAVLLDMIRHVVSVEGPVLDAVLARRVARAHGFGRTGSRIQERIDRLALSEFEKTVERGIGRFYWPHAVSPGTAIPFRQPSDENNSRAVEEICMQELGSLARALLVSGLSGEAAVIAMARQVGLLRLRAASRGRLEAALAEASFTDRQ